MHTHRGSHGEDLPDAASQPGSWCSLLLPTFLVSNTDMPQSSLKQVQFKEFLEKNQIYLYLVSYLGWAVYIYECMCACVCMCVYLSDFNEIICIFPSLPFSAAEPIKYTAE